ncbi:3-hydroxy-3-methylglutaryl-coenzyme A (HMG-CoA) reductase isozyme [Ancistrocladus abbreviatus]
MPIGFVQIRVGIAGPLSLDGLDYWVPMATTEGYWIASTNTGCKAIRASGSATTLLLKDAMTRAPVVRFPFAKRTSQLKFFLENHSNFQSLADIFNKSSRFGRLQSIQCSIAGRNLYIRFSCSTGDAMGMNMVSRGVENVLDFLQNEFPDMDIIGISGNFCSDKKSAAVNWIEGCGKSIVCEAVIKEEVVKKVLETSVASFIELNMLRNLVCSAVAGALGGFIAHASRIVSSILVATGQDPAQNVEGSHCITMMEAANDGKDLHISVTMPSVEILGPSCTIARFQVSGFALLSYIWEEMNVGLGPQHGREGTVGGGMQLAPQAACLNLLGELSLMSAIAAGQLVESHMKLSPPRDQ